MRHKSHKQLKRTIGLFQAVFFGISLILGAGIFSIVGEVAAIAGNAMWMSFVLAAVLALITGLSYAELSSMYPKSAGEYLFVKSAFENDFLASLIGCIVIFVAISSASTVAVGFAGYLSIFLPHISEIIIAIILIALMSFVSFCGISESAHLNIILTVIELFGLLFVVGIAFLSGSITNINYFEFPVAVNFYSNIILVISATSLVFFAYFGFEYIINIADEIINPAKVIPRALIISIIITTMIYILVSISSIALVGWKTLSLSNAPLAKAVEKSTGNMGIGLLSIIGLFATSNTVMIMLISSSRIIYGITENKKSFLANLLSRVHQKKRTPWIAILFVMFIAFIIIFTFKGNLSIMAGISVFGIFIIYIIVHISLIILRYKKTEIRRPFRMPLQIGKFPILAGLGICISSILMLQINFETIRNSIIVIALIFFSVSIAKLTKKVW